MSQNVFYSCSNISKILNGDLDVVGYRVTHPTAWGDNQSCDFFIMKMKGFDCPKFGEKNGAVVRNIRKSVPLDRDNISQVVEEAGVVKSFREECFCESDENRHYCVYTTEAE